MSERVRSADKLLSITLESPEKLQALRDNPTDELPKIVKEAKQLTGESFIISNIYVIVVSALGLVGLIAIIGAIILSALSKDAPQVLVALGSAAVGGLVGLLAPSPKS
jgi:hypothetical protein